MPRSILSLLVLFVLIVFFSADCAAQAIGQTNSVEKEISRMGKVLGLSNDAKQAIQSAISNTPNVEGVEEFAGLRNAGLGLNLGADQVDNKVMLALFQLAYEHADDAKVDAYIEDYQKTEALYCEFVQNGLLMHLDQELSLSLDQRRTIAAKAKEVWTSEWNRVAGRVRFDGFPRAEPIMEAIGLIDVLTETQKDLYNRIRTKNVNINVWKEWADQPKEIWEPEFRATIDRCMAIEISNLGDEIRADKTFQKRIAVVKRKVTNDLVNDRELFFTEIRESANFFENRPLMRHFSSTPMQLIVEFNAWKKGLKNALTEEQKEHLKENEVARQEMQDKAACYAVICNALSLVRVSHEDTMGVYQLAKSQLSREIREDEPPRWHYYSTFELPDEKWLEHVTEDGWKLIKPNVDDMREHANGARNRFLKQENTDAETGDE